MPRKKKTKEERERTIEKIPLTQEEINSLEQRLEKDEEKIDTSELREFLDEQRMPKSSPSLNKINAPQRIPTRLETNLIEDPVQSINSNGEENDPFKYTSGNGGKQGEEAKYVKYEGMIIENRIPRGEIQNIGKGNPLEKREVGFESSPQARISVQENFEKYTAVRKVDKEKLGKESPFERKEIKYTPEKY